MGKNSWVANSLDRTGFAKWANSEVKRPLMNPSSEEEELLPNSQTEKVRVSTTERRLPDDSFITKMKKYTKLILSVVAVISFFSFVFYKFCYDRLYNVMQVLEVFGTPDDPSVQPCTSEEEWVPPTWQNHGPSLHLFSAHCSASSDSPSNVAYGSREQQKQWREYLPFPIWKLGRTTLPSLSPASQSSQTRCPMQSRFTLLEG